MVSTRGSIARLQAASPPSTSALDRNSSRPEQSSETTISQISSGHAGLSSSGSTTKSPKQSVIGACDERAIGDSISEISTSASKTQTLWSDFLQLSKEQKRPTFAKVHRLPSPRPNSEGPFRSSHSSPQSTETLQASPVASSSNSTGTTTHRIPPAQSSRSPLASPSKSNVSPCVLQPSTSAENALGMSFDASSSMPVNPSYQSFMPRICLSGRPRRDAPPKQSRDVVKTEVGGAVKLVRQVRKIKIKSSLSSKQVSESDDSGLDENEGEHEVRQVNDLDGAQMDELDEDMDTLAFSSEAAEAEYTPELESASGKAKARRMREGRGPRKVKPKSAQGGPPRPPNAWILYRSAQIQSLKTDTETSRKPQSEISKLIGVMWQKETADVKEAYMEQARAKQAEHVLLYPDYSYQPNRKPGSGSNKTKTSARPGNPRRSTAPTSTDGSAKKTKSERRSRATSSESLMSSFRVSHCTSSSAASSLFDFGGPGSTTPMIPHTPYIYHYDTDYGTDFVIDQSVEALLATLNDTALTSSTAPRNIPLSAPATYNDAENSWNGFSPATSVDTCHDPVLVDDYMSSMVPWSAPADLTNFNFDHVPSVFGDCSPSFADFSPIAPATATPSPMAPSLSSSASSEITSYSISRQLDFSTLSPDRVNLTLREQQQQQQQQQHGPSQELNVPGWATTATPSSLASPINMLEPFSPPLPPPMPLAVSPVSAVTGEFARLGRSPLARAHSLSYGPGPEPSDWTVTQQAAYEEQQQQEMLQAVQEEQPHLHLQQHQQQQQTVQGCIHPRSIESWIEEAPFAIDLQSQGSYAL